MRLLLLLLPLMPHHITFNLFIIYFFDFKSVRLLHYKIYCNFCNKSAGLGIYKDILFHQWGMKNYSEPLSCSAVCKKKIFWQFNFDANFFMLTSFSLKCINFYFHYPPGNNWYKSKKQLRCRKIMSFASAHENEIIRVQFTIFFAKFTSL